MATSAAAVRSPWHVLVATSVGVVAVFVNISGVAVALPTMTRELGATASQANWILISYMLVTTALILVFGRVADMFGRRPVYIAGLAVFTAATLACALSGSASMLIAARVVQAIGAAAIVTNTTAILTDAFPSRILGRGLGWNAAVAAIGQMAGPVVGGVATAWWGWSGLFWICIPLGLCALVGSFVVVPPRGENPAAREPFDGIGACLSTAALVAAVCALTPGIFGEGRPWAPWVSGATAVMLFAAFLMVQHRRRFPLVDLTLFADRSRATLYAAVLLNAVSQYALVLMASLYVQATQNSDPLAAGVLVLPAAVGTLLAASAVGSLVNRIEPRLLCAFGMAAIAFGACGFAASAATESNMMAMGGSLFVVGFGTGVFMTPSTSALMFVVSEQRRGIANGVRSALQNVGFLVSTALALAVATAGLDPDSRRAAYGGTLTTLGSGRVDVFVDGVVHAAAVLAIVAAIGAVVCATLPRQYKTQDDRTRLDDNRLPEEITR
nr:MFS transporter [Rhodococcus sp. (in: high G+C Gram-positive bacteria)]